MTGTEIYKRTETYERDAKAIRLHAPQWKVLLAFDGQSTLAEVALSADVPFAEALPLTEKFLARGWVEEQPITLDQYLKRTGTTAPSAMGAVPPVTILHEPKPEATEPPPEPSIVEKTAEPTPQPEVVSVTPTPRGPMRLSSVINFIITAAANRSLGQLLVYRVFLRLSPELLLAEDIATVHLVNDPGVIRSEALQSALARVVNEIVKRPLPESVFAAA